LLAALLSLAGHSGAQQDAQRLVLGLSLPQQVAKLLRAELSDGLD
jgi:hypothetical protein